MKPMLAFKAKPSKLSFPGFVQPKFNGVRALYLPKHRNLQSRDEHFWDPVVLPHLLSELTDLGFATDGELYKHGMSLQQIYSRVAVNRIVPHDKVTEISYYIFDIISQHPMWQRVDALEMLRKMFETRKHLVIAPTYLVHTEAEIDYYYQQWRAQGYEGLMFRTYDAPYGMEHNCGNKENRWWYLQKKKEMQDLEATITGVYEGEDGFIGLLGGFNCVTDEGVEFNVGGGLTLDERNYFWLNQRVCIGARIRINFEMFSDGRVPLKPIIETVYELH